MLSTDVQHWICVANYTVVKQKYRNMNIRKSRITHILHDEKAPWNSFAEILFFRFQVRTVYHKIFNNKNSSFYRLYSWGADWTQSCVLWPSLSEVSILINTIINKVMASTKNRILGVHEKAIMPHTSAPSYWYCVAVCCTATRLDLMSLPVLPVRQTVLTLVIMKHNNLYFYESSFAEI